MKRLLKKYFIPHKENAYKPHLLREFSVVFLSFLIIFLIPFFAFIYTPLITSNFLLSAIFPSALVSLTNDARSSANAPVLQINSVLGEAARLKAEDMIKKNYFAHVSPEGLTPWHWLEQAGYNFSAAGENLAIDFSDSKDVSDAWLSSPGHRANILNKKFTEIGIATARGVFNERETVFVVQFFGKPVDSISKTPAVSDAAGKQTEPISQIAEKNTPTVLSAEDSKEVTEENSLFIIVKNSEDNEMVGEFGESALRRKNAGAVIFETISSPKTLLFYSYILLSLLISLSLIFVIFIETARKHVRHIVYGAFLLVLSFGALYFSALFFPGSVVLVI